MNRSTVNRSTRSGRVRGTLTSFACASLLACGPEIETLARDVASVDLNALGPGEVRRVYGSTGNGSLGLAVAGGYDVDGDGFLDSAFAAMQSSPNDVRGAGRVYLVFGDGTTRGELDTAVPDPNILRIDGGVPFEYAGSELWMDDVTGDGLADLLIARQNYTATATDGSTESGAGALAIVAGGPALRALSNGLETLALEDPPEGVALTLLIGAEPNDRLGIWMRSGDLTGDGIHDLVVGADQSGLAGMRAGVVYVIAGGPHLAGRNRFDLGATAGSALDGYVAEIVPPAEPSPAHYHFGATCQLADLDGNGRAEVLAAAALNRAGAALDTLGGTSATATAGAPDGHLFILWDDNFPALPWPAGFAFAVGAGAGRHTVLRGSVGNRSFGEELIGGLDWDQDGNADLFVGDLTANFAGRPDSGSSHIIYEAHRLAGLDTDILTLPLMDPPVRTTMIMGVGPGDISGDTAAHGDFSGDGRPDLVFCSPHASPFGRHSAGVVHVLAGVEGGWPERIDLRRPSDDLGLFEVYGAHGTFGTDRGDTLCYSAAWGDLDADGRQDLITNEMVGNGLGPEALNAGNLIVLSGALLGGLGANPTTDAGK